MDDLGADAKCPQCTITYSDPTCILCAGKGLVPKALAAVVRLVGSAPDKANDAIAYARWVQTIYRINPAFLNKEMSFAWVLYLQYAQEADAKQMP